MVSVWLILNLSADVKGESDMASADQAIYLGKLSCLDSSEIENNRTSALSTENKEVR